MADAKTEPKPQQSDPDILVVLPTLGDRIDTLAETLASIDAQRTQVSLTLVVVSPPGATEARALAKRHSAVLVDDPKRGISEAINCGIAARTTERFYAWMGDDDLFRPGGLHTLRELLLSSPEAVVAYGGCDYISPDGATLVTSRAGRLAQFLLPWGPDLIPHPGSMILLDELAAIGNFDPTLKYAMDLDAFLKLSKRGQFVYTTESVSAFRWHPDSLTVANRSASSQESERVKIRHLPRWVRPFNPLWRYPVRWASALAAKRVSARA